ncbi:helix-turn-helix domain-containing protein [Eubacterium callanderi]|uniref:helix-turn-helix domain-containing protein n=1 Tax=Eubacterium callanderi TaxID=53442 RepID=UPI003AB57C67
MNERLRELREYLGLSQRAFGDQVDIGQSTIAMFEKAQRSLRDIHIKRICTEFNVNEKWLRNGEGSMFIEPSEPLEEIKEIIDTLDIEHLQKMKECLDMIIEYREHNGGIAVLYPETVSRPVFDLPAAAGTGQFLDSYGYTDMSFPADVVPPDSNFGVRISGDSMEPEFSDGEIVFVKQQPTLNNGDIGIFVLNTDGYLKKFCLNENGYTLVSFNPKYEPIKITENDNIRIVGKVLGKYKF